MPDTRIQFDNRILSYPKPLSINESRVLGGDIYSIPVASNSLRFAFGVDTNNNEPFNPLKYIWAKGTWKHISGNVWEWTYNDPIWNASGTSNGAPIFGWNSYLNNAAYISIIGGNTVNITNMDRLFYNLPKLNNIYSYMDGSSETQVTHIGYMQSEAVTSMIEMFCKTPISRVPISNFQNVLFMQGFIDISTVDLFNPSDPSTFNNPMGFGGWLPGVHITPPRLGANIASAFKGCKNMSGEIAYQIYQDITSIGTHTGTVSQCFRDCATYDPDPHSQSLYQQIPSSWR